jgi:hypothetical protein
MVISTEPAWGDAIEQFVREYENAIVYADIDQETVVYEGQVRVLANGWVELPTGRLLSPDAVHHIDTQTG